MNTFFVTTGRALANVLDGTIDASRKAITETGGAGKSFAAGWKSQRSMNAMKRRYGDSKRAVRTGVSISRCFPSWRRLVASTSTAG
jgi:hypothetical protein